MLTVSIHLLALRSTLLQQETLSSRLAADLGTMLDFIRKNMKLGQLCIIVLLSEMTLNCIGAADTQKHALSKEGME